MNIQNLINNEIRNNSITKEEIMNEKSLFCSVDDSEEIIIKNTFENVSNFIIMAAYAIEEDVTIDFYINDECFMNTVGHYINLCSNSSYLEDLKKVLVPLQLEYEKALASGEGFNRTFLALVDDEWKEFKMLTDEKGHHYFDYDKED